MAQTHTCTCSCEPQPHFNTAHDLRVTHCPERAIAQSLSIPFCRHRSSMPVHGPTETQRLVSKQLQIKTQRFDLQGWSASAKAWLTRERLQTEELWTTATRESPRHGDPSHKKQLLPHCRRSMTTAFCSSPAYRTQEPSNH